jgi:gliding-associated putative ABC transporter substrate-binding component GldG
MFRFVSSLDTVKADGVKKTPLIFGSDYSRKLAAPVRIAFEDMSDGPDLNQFTIKNLPLMYLLEGEFTSFYKNRFLPEGTDKSKFLESGKGKVLVSGSGQLFTSLFSVLDTQPLALGQDPFSEVSYANRQLLQNSINFLTDPEGIIATRTKQFQIRPLNKLKVQNEKAKWQLINVLSPVLFFLFLGLIWIGLKKSRFSRK